VCEPLVDLFDKCNRYTRAREAQAAGFYPYFIPASSSVGTEVEIDGHRLIMIGSNNYLGLTHHPRVIGAARQALESFGSSCTGSRFLSGTLQLHEDLEQRLAGYLRREAALVFSTGFQTNLGVISALCGRGDVIFCDRENHASIIDGCRLTFADVKKFRHNDTDQLESLLQRACDSSKTGANGKPGMLIIVDGAFSMMGDLANLPAITELAKKYGARLLVDEAHSVGVMGDHGRGVAEHYGVEDGVDLIVGTFSKSLASIGGFVAGSEDVIHYIKHHARSMIFSASIPASAAAAALTAVEIIEEQPELLRRVRSSAARVRNGLEKMGYHVGASQTPIVPVVVGSVEGTIALWQGLFKAGLFTNMVISPAVPPGMELIRTSYMATHTDEQLSRVLEIFEHVGHEVGLLTRPLQRATTTRYGGAAG